MTFSFLVGNTDMHAKNISFLRHPDGRVELTPAYDVAMHLHHPRGDRRSALDINGRHRLDDISLADVGAEGMRWGMTGRRTQRVVAETVAALRDALDTIDRDLHPGVPAAAWDVIDRRTSAALEAGAR